MSRAVIIAGGTIENYEFISGFLRADDYIICADSGIVHCDKMNLKANLWVGDFDSCDYDKYVSCTAAQNAEIVRLPAEKDKTDTEYALDCAQQKNFKSILLIGGCGTRLDHTFSNIYLLEYAENNGMTMQIVTDKNRIRFLKDGGLGVQRDFFKYVSILPVSEIVTGVTCIGFKYTLTDAILVRYSSFSVSNELVSETGTINVSVGCALVIESVD